SVRAYLAWGAAPPRGSACQTASQVRGASFSSSSATHETPRRSRVMVMSLGMLDLPVDRGGRERRHPKDSSVRALWDPSWPCVGRLRRSCSTRFLSAVAGAAADRADC